MLGRHYMKHVQLLTHGRPSVGVSLDYHYPVVVRGLVDTGASQTAMCYEIAERFEMPIVGAVRVVGINAEPEVAPVYEVRMRFPTGRFFTTEVIGLQCVCHYDILIGRDLIDRVRLTLGRGYLSATVPGPRSTRTIWDHYTSAPSAPEVPQPP